MPDLEGYARQMGRTISADQGNIRYGTRGAGYEADTARDPGEAISRGAMREFRKYRGVTRALGRVFRSGSR